MKTGQEEWVQWKPIEWLAKKYYIYSILHTVKSFEILLFEEDTSRAVQVIFESTVYAHRDTEEAFRQKKISMLYDLYGKDFYTQWTLTIGAT